MGTTLPGLPAPDLGGWEGLVSTALNVGANIYQGITQMKAQKKAVKAAQGTGAYYGGPSMRAGFAGYGTGYSGPSGINIGGPGGVTMGDYLPSYGGPNTPIDYGGGGGCGFFVAPRAGPHARAVSLMMQVNPDTGKLHYWRHVGTPILYSGDVSHCKTVNRILNRARRGGRARRKS